MTSCEVSTKRSTKKREGKHYEACQFPSTGGGFKHFFNVHLYLGFHDQMGGKKPPTSHVWLVGIQGEVSVTSGWRLDFLADFAIPYEISDGLVP